MFFLPTLLGWSQAWAFEATATVDSRRMGLNETLRLSVDATGSGPASVDESAMVDFKILSKSASSRISVINGQASRKQTHTWILAPLRTGSLEIPPLTVVQNGEKKRTERIVIEVLKEKPAADASRDVWAQAAVSTSDPWAGQQIRYTLRLYSAVRIANARIQNMPDFKGFEAKKIEKDRNFQASFDGRTYQGTELVYILSPHQTGELVIDPALLQCDVETQDSKRSPSFPNSFFDDPFFGSQRLEPRLLRTQKIRLNVKPLPPFDGPGEFSGLIGTFHIDASLDRKRVAAGESVTLSTVVSGRGNIMDAQAPKMNFPQGLKTYEDKPEEDIRQDQNGFSGKKTFRVALVPLKKGRHSLKPAALTFFNVKKGDYQTIASPALSLFASASNEKSRPDLRGSGGSPETFSLKKKKVTFTGRDILPLKESLDALSPPWRVSFLVFLIMLAAPVIGYFLILILLARKKNGDDPASLMRKRGDDYLKKASLAKSDDGFLDDLRMALICGILAKAGTTGETLTYEEAGDILRQCGHEDDVCRQGADLLKKIEASRYGAAAMSGPEKKSLMGDVEKLIKTTLL